MKSTGEEMIFRSSFGEFRRVIPGIGEIGVGVLSLENHGQVTGVHFAGCDLRRFDIFGCFDRRHRRAEIVRRSASGPRFSVGADRLDRKPLGEDGVVPDLIQLCVRQSQTRSKFDPDLFAVDHRIDAAMAYIHEGEEFVDREEVLGPVTELPRDITRIVRECAGGVARLPPALVLQRLRQVPVIECRKWFNAGFEKRIDQAAVEVEAFCVRLTGAVGKDSRPGDRRTDRS